MLTAECPALRAADVGAHISVGLRPAITSSVDKYSFGTVAEKGGSVVSRTAAERECSSRVARKAVQRAERLARLPDFDPSACHVFVTGVIDTRAPVTLESDGRVWILDDRKWVGVHVRDGEQVTLSRRNIGMRRSRVDFRAERGGLYFFRARSMFRRAGVLLKATRTSSDHAVCWEVH